MAEEELELYDMMKQAMKKTKGMADTLSLGDETTPLIVRDVLSTGLPNLDKILCVSKDNNWGLPVGKIISIKSKPSVGKTTFLLRIADEAIKRHGAVHIIESEHALDLKYARRISSFVDSFFISQPDTLEEAFEVARSALDVCAKVRKTDNDAPFVIIFDSFSGFSPSAELDGDFGTGGKALGEHARIASMACRKLTGAIAKAKAIMILSHQVKSKIGVYWGSQETNIGGDALNFHDSISLNMYRTKAIKDSKGRIAGHYGLIKTTKNKLFPPHREVPFKIINGRGFNRMFAVLDYLLSKKVIIKTGAWFHFRGEKELKWQGADGFSSFVKSSKKARRIIKENLK